MGHTPVGKPEITEPEEEEEPETAIAEDEETQEAEVDEPKTEKKTDAQNAVHEETQEPDEARPDEAVELELIHALQRAFPDTDIEEEDDEEACCCMLCEECQLILWAPFYNCICCL